VEVNESFVQPLKNVPLDVEFQTSANRAKVHCTRIENLPPIRRMTHRFGLPLNNFAVADVRADS